MKRTYTTLVAAVCLLLCHTVAHAQLQVTATQNTQNLINAIVGQGVTVSNITVNCPNGAIGTFNGNGSNVGLPGGVLLTTGRVTNAVGGGNTSSNAGTDHGQTLNDPNLTSVAAGAIYDVCILEFDIIPTCNSLAINFVFGSEEYPEYVGQINDAFGFFISGPNPGGGNYNGLNIAKLPNGTAISINTVNASTNSASYVNNGDGTCFGLPPLIPFPANCTNPNIIQYDGFTRPLTAAVSVTPCSTYHMKIAIGDAVDGLWDSGVFLSSGGLFCQGAQNMAVTFTNNLTCTAPNSGTSTANVTGGTPPYNYTWSTTPTQNTQTATGLTAGTYTVTITDNGCSSVTATTTLTTVGPTITFTKVDIPCNGGTTGSATVNVTGGTAPITIAWSNAVNTANNPNLVAGTYSVTVTDNIGCYATGSVTISQAGTLTATASSTAAACGATNGTVSVTASGGTAPYTYTWSNGPTSQNQSNLAAGSYTVTVRDNAGCTRTATTTITTPSSFTLAFATTPGNCSSTTSSSVDMTVTGGTAPFTYVWSNAANTQDLANVAAGTYTVTVTDGSGCVVTGTATTTVPTPVTATIANTPVNCSGGNNGTATVTPTGTAPFTYVWSNGGNTATISNLAAGVYTITVTGTGGCTATASTTVTQPTTLTVTIASNNPTCTAPSSGSATATASGGTGPYTYLWSTTANTAAINNLAAGSYTVTATDANGCTATASTTLTVPSNFTIAVDTTTGNCFQPNSAAIDITITGGTAPFTYAWSNSANTEDLNNIPEGNYTVTVTDASGCVQTANAGVYVLKPVSLVFNNRPISCIGGSDAVSVALASGGVQPYTYQWSHGPTTDTVTGLGVGAYSATVTSAEGCTATGTVNITPVVVTHTATLAVVQPSCPALGNGSITANATPPALGPYKYLWSNGDTTQTIANLINGNYSVTITSIRGCTITESATLTNPPAVTVAVTTTPELCNNANSGTATAAISGGTTPYNISWNNGSTAANPTNLAPGSYTVTITDANGCSATSSGTVNPSTLPTVGITAVNPTCNGATNGSVQAVGSFATYTWGHGATTNPSTGLAAGNYNVTVTDAGGCTASASTTLTQPTVLTLSLTPTQLNCNIPSSGSVASNAGGGMTPYTYLWSNGATTASLSNLGPGTYSVTVTDANGCTITDAATLATPNPPSLTLNVIPVNCTGPNTASIDAVVTGGTAPITYSWNTGATTSNLANIGAGTYSVTISDATGCTSTRSSTISAIPSLYITVDTINPSCFGSIDGKIDVFGAYTTFTWSHGDQNMPTTGLGAGTYTVTVNDNNNCSATRTFNLTEPTALQLSIAPTPIDCSDPNSGALQANVSGGTPTYQYLWSNAATVASLNNLSNGTYTVTVTDANSCSTTATEILTPNPASSVSLGGNVILCPGDSAVFNLDTITAPMVWHNGSTGNRYTAYSNETVSVTVDYPNGCQGQDAVTVTLQNEVALYPINDTTLCETEWVSYTAGPVGFTYEWSDGTFGPQITIVDSGSYVVTAISGCNVVQDTVTVHIEKCNCEVFLPNAFSPNGDGVNDYFQAYAECSEVSGFRLRIFDRWGEVVYTSTDFDGQWDGSTKGANCIPGVYVWHLVYVQAINGRNYEQAKKGSVVLLK